MHDPAIRYLVKTVLDKATAVLRQCQEDGEQPLLCSEFAAHSYGEAVFTDQRRSALGQDVATTAMPGTQDSHVPNVAQRRCKQLSPTAASIPAQSLLGHLQQHYGSVPDALAAVQGGAAAGRAPQVSDAVLDILIEAILAQRSGGSRTSRGRSARRARGDAPRLAGGRASAGQRPAQADRRRPAARPGTFGEPLTPPTASPAETLWPSPPNWSPRAICCVRPT